MQKNKMSKQGGEMGSSYLLCQFTSGSQNQSLTASIFGIDGLENWDYKGSCFASTRLSLGDHVSARNTRLNGTLLNCRRLFETKSINTTEKMSFQTHLVKWSHFGSILKWQKMDLTPNKTITKTNIPQALRSWRIQVQLYHNNNWFTTNNDQNKHFK